MTMTTQQRDAQVAPVSRIAKWAPLAVILTGTFVYILDFFVLNVALPDIQRSLHASAAAIEWLVSGYALTSASLLVCGGRLGDHYGRRRVFVVGVVWFAIASAGCAAAPTATAARSNRRLGLRISARTCRVPVPASS